MPIPIKTKPITRSCMREEVYNTLLSWIVEGKLHPGEKLLDKELAEYMGVSRTPVREALRRLEDKQLVESSANRWTRVTEISINELEKIYPIIWSLEELAVSQAIDLLTLKDFKEMELANRALAKAIKNEDPVDASMADIRFHDVLLARAGNQQLFSILYDLKIQCRRVEINYFTGCCGAKYSLSEHERILEALQSKDLILAQSMIRVNWQNSLQRVKENKDTSTHSSQS